MLKAKQKNEKRNMSLLIWVLREVQSTDRHFLPLAILKLLLELAKTYWPILLMAPLLEALLQKNYPYALQLALTYILGQMLLNLSWTGLNHR